MYFVCYSAQTAHKPFQTSLEKQTTGAKRAYCPNIYTVNPVVKPHHLESLEFVFIGAAPVGEVLASKFKEKAPNCQFREGK